MMGAAVFLLALHVKLGVATLLPAVVLFIITKLEQYDYTGATAIAVVMLLVSFVLLLTINLLQAWTRKRGQSERKK